MFVTIHSWDTRKSDHHSIGLYGSVPRPIMESRVTSEAMNHVNLGSPKRYDGPAAGKGYLACLWRNLSAALFVRAKFGADAIGEVETEEQAVLLTKAMFILFVNGVQPPVDVPFKIQRTNTDEMMSVVDTTVPYPIFSPEMSAREYETMCAEAERNAKKKDSDARLRGAMLTVYGREEV